MKLYTLKIFGAYLRTAAVEHPRVRLAKLTLQLWRIDAAHREIWYDDPTRPVGRGRVEEFFYERGIITDQIDGVKSRMLISRAESLDVDVPVAHEDWESSTRVGMTYLVERKSRELRKAVRAAEAERWIAREARLKVLGTALSAAAGLVGALIGLAAILRR